MGEPSLAVENWVATGRTILVVEDEILIRMVLADELRVAGYRVLEALNADEALAILRGGAHIDLLFTDVQMPGSMNGHALARVTKSEFPEIKIVVGSAQALNAVSDVADAIFEKPYDLSALTAEINTLLA